ncbi:MAG: tyrosine-type recombinase/integrase [Armatimonadota bacterium]
MAQEPKNCSTLSDAITDYLTWHSLRGSSQCHQSDLRRTLRVFSDRAGADRPIEQLTRADCEALLKSARDRGLKPNTLKAYHRVLDAFFHWLVAEERLEETPMRRVPKPQLPREQVKPLTSEELVRLLHQPDGKSFTGVRDQALIAFLADTGLRISEALAVRFCDIDARARSVSVIGKGGKGRTVFYGEAVAALLKTYVARRSEVGERDLLWVSSLNEPLLRTSVTRRIKCYGKRAGIDGKRVSAHTLRHTFGVTWCLNGGDAFSLQRLLGHSTPAMTARYVNFASGDLAKMHKTVSPLDSLPGRPGTSQGSGRRKRLV